MKVHVWCGVAVCVMSGLSASSAEAQVTARSADITQFEDTTATVQFGCNANGVMNGCDNAKYVVVSQSPPGLGTLLGSDASRTFEPNPNFHFGTTNSAYMTPVTILYDITDVPGAPIRGSIVLRFEPQADIPVPGTTQQATNEDTPLTIGLVVSDPDTDTGTTSGFPVTLTGSGDTLTYTQGNQPQNGTLVWNPPNPVYTPNPNYNGSDSFTYSVSDGQGNMATETVNVVINPVNDPPEAVTETITISEDQTTNITLKATDVDGQSTFTYVVTQMPTNGTLTGQIPSFTYTPNLDFTGQDTIKFTVSDGLETSAEGTITINIGQADDPPVWAAGTPDDNSKLTVDEGETLEFTASATDPDGDTITYSLAGVAGLNGASFDTATGVFSWSPSYMEIGSYDVTLKATDPFNPQGIERKLTIEVLLVDDDGDNLPKTFEESINLDPTKNDTDGDTISDSYEVGDIANPSNVDGDAEIDALDQDSDNDGIRDSDEAGDNQLSTSPNDADADGVADFRETDSDGDGTEDSDDNCRLKRNSGQENLDNDAFGDACDEDIDGDGVLNSSDLCATEAAATTNGCPESQRTPPTDDDEGCATAGQGTPSTPGVPMMLFVAMLAMVGLVRRRRS